MMKHALTLFAAVVLVACSSTPPGNLDGGTDGSPRVGIDQLGRTPLPVGSRIRSADSLILGVGDNWLGRAVLDVPMDASATYNFFADQFPRQGWTLVSALRGKTSLQVYTRGDRSATLEMAESGLLGAGVVATLTISPLPSASGAGASGAAPAGPGVVVQPVRRP